MTGIGAIELIAIDHVQLAMPPGAEAIARSFYVDVLGLREVPKPAELADRGGCWFTTGSVDVHLGSDEPFAPATRAHPAFVVHDVDVARRTLVAAGVAVLDDPSGVDVRRCYAFDPFGNRIELVDAADRGFTRRGDSA